MSPKKNTNFELINEIKYIEMDQINQSTLYIFTLHG